MNRFFLLLCSVLGMWSATAQNLSPSERLIKTATDNCLSAVSNGKADAAFSTIFTEYWKDKASAPQATATMQRQYREVVGRVEDSIGKTVPGGYEYLGIKRLGTSVIKLVYLQKNERFFLPWAFSFYQGAGEWKLTFITFPDIGSDDLKDFVVTDLAHPSGKFGGADQ